MTHGPLWLTALISRLLTPTDLSPDWHEGIEPGDDPPDPTGESGADAARAGAASVVSGSWGARALGGVVVDMTERAARVAYDGTDSIKRTRYPRVALGSRRCCVVLHQTGVQRAETSDRWHRVTAHFVVGPEGVIRRLHPVDVRLVAANRLDRAPFHAVSIEVGGNFEGVDGRGDWYKPERFGRGRASEAQISAVRVAVALAVQEVAARGGRVEAILPHRVSGRGRNGRPNRPLCPGSRIWAEAGESSALALGLRVPGPAQSWGGSPVPDSWHGPAFDDLRRLGMVGWEA